MHTKPHHTLLALLFNLVLALSAGAAATIDAPAQLPLMPYPQQVEQAQGSFTLSAGTPIQLRGAQSAQTRAAVQRFQQRLQRQTGIELSTHGDSAQPALTLSVADGSAQPHTLDGLTPEREAYQLHIRPHGIALEAASPQGLRHGLETLLQLSGGEQAREIQLPALSISDWPRFRWRGLLLDSARHFFSVDTIKRQLDGMAAAKLNIFHWHLSDDQGWRLESVHYPELHRRAAGGLYYTRAQVREIVAYAHNLGIQVLPEIGMPGHSSAIGLAYPELMSAPGPYPPEERWGVHRPLLDPSNPAVYEFAEKILGEVAELFPFEYVHIGGDEVDPRDWQENPKIRRYMRSQRLNSAQDLHNHFNSRIAEILAAHGRRMIGWDEILHPQLAAGTAVQSWRGQDALAEIARQGHPAILSTGFYLDQPQYTAYHYRNEPLPQTLDVRPPQAGEFWHSWQFEFPRKRGAAIRGSFTLIHDTEGNPRGFIDFEGRARRALHSIEIRRGTTYFRLDTWMGPLWARLQLRDDKLDGDMVVGNAPYAVRGKQIAGHAIAGHAIAGSAPPEAVAAVELSTELPRETQRWILGGEAALWSEMVDENSIDLRLWPRGFAVAERLWSAQSLRDENAMYRRLAQVERWVETSLDLNPHRQQITALARLLPQSQHEAALALSGALEPAHYYHRHHEKSVHASYSRRDPLDRFADTLPVESVGVRRIAQSVEHWLQTGDGSGLESAREILAHWQRSAGTLLADIAEGGDPGEFREIAARVREVSELGQQLIDLVLQESGMHAPAEARARAQLRRAQQIHGEVVVAAAYPLERLLDELPQTEDWTEPGSFTDGIEGPALGPDGKLYVVNFQRQGTIGVVLARGKADVFLELPEGSIGNSIRFDNRGRMLIADYTGHNVWRVDPASGKILNRFHQGAMHQPNDIAVSRAGFVYATDPDWSSGGGQLWMLNPEGEFTLLEGNMGTTNGIELSPDERRLYVNESVQRRVYVYDVAEDGGIGNKRLLIEFPDHGLDGMAVDSAGNLYIARYGAGEILVVSPEGERMREIRLRGRFPTNIVLDEARGRAFVTMQRRGNVESFLIGRNDPPLAQ